MNVLITGSRGFIGSNLIARLEEIRRGSDRTRAGLTIDGIFGIDKTDAEEDLREALSAADAVIHLAGCNRPDDPEDFDRLNVDLTAGILSMLRGNRGACPVIFASSIQAGLQGRFAGSAYGMSKKRAEELLLEYHRETGARVMICRFPNVFGKWCRPNYNSVVATFCSAVANDLPYTVNDPETVLDLIYIDDLADAILDMLETLSGRDEKTIAEAERAECTEDLFAALPEPHRVTLGELAALLEEFRTIPASHELPELREGSFAWKLYSTYLSYLPPEKAAFPLRANRDERGSFTEVLRTKDCGQFSVNTIAPGMTKGEHWHNSKTELFVVVKGEGLIRQRRIGIDTSSGSMWPVSEMRVSGSEPQAVMMLPGYTHEIRNISEDEELIMVIWTNEVFDASKPDTFRRPVDDQ